MIGTTGATVLFIFNVLLAALLGISAGGIASLFLRQRWNLKVFFIDGATSATVAITAAYVLGVLDTARHVWKSRVVLIFAIAAASVLVRHLFRLLFRFRA
jgi:hypothetical protein